MRRSRIGVIGAGAVGMRHAQTLLGFEDVQVVAVADPAPERRAALAVICEARSYEGYESMLQSEELDAIYICVPPFAHGAVEMAIISAGIPFFVEKPLALDAATATVIAEAVREAGLITATGYHLRCLDTFDRALAMVRTTPAQLVVGLWLDKVPPAAWWTQLQGSGGQVVEQATHVLDLARALVGEVEQVYGLGARIARPEWPTADVDDVSSATLRFMSGAVGSLSCTSLLRSKHTTALHLYGDGLAIHFSDGDLTIDEGGGPATIFPTVDPKVRVDRDFIDAVQGEPNRIRVPYADAVKSHLLACAVARSAHEGRPIQVNELSVL
ncbi:MAG: Gfo/Idh/MocA family oxidoreductase [Actinomycetota bacterium]|nr:Gfo/Idh/MocA family oxidoreductase [Actinomycetota bacterium]